MVSEKKKENSIETKRKEKEFRQQQSAPESPSCRHYKDFSQSKRSTVRYELCRLEKTELKKQKNFKKRLNAEK